MNKRREKQLQAARAGFTLVELLVVLAIIGLLLTAVVASTQIARTRSRDARRLSDLRQIQTALALYEGINQQYPTDMYGAGVLVPTFMTLVPTDPLGARLYVYATSGTQNDYHLGATIEEANSVSRDTDSDFDSAAAGWTNGFNGLDDGGPCRAGDPGAFCYDAHYRR